MRSAEDKGSYNNYGLTHQEISSSSNAISFEFHKGNGGGGGGPNRTHRTALGKPTPSKWDDAQKWLVGLSRGGVDKSQSKPRNSNADDRRLIAPVPHEDYSGPEDDEVQQVPNGFPETKKIDCDNDSIWRIHKPVQNSTTAAAAVRSICVRDMGTEMTPMGSQEPSRTATPIRATTPAARSPISSGSSTPVRCHHGLKGPEGHQTGSGPTESRGGATSVANGSSLADNKDLDQARQVNPLEARAMAWDEAERAKYMARYKREEVKIQAWENHQKRKAEMEIRKMEVKAERLKARAQERLANKLATTKRIAEEKRANAEAKLNEQAVRTSERADYIRRTGHLPYSFSFKLPSLCW